MPYKHHFYRKQMISHCKYAGWLPLSMAESTSYLNWHIGNMIVGRTALPLTGYSSHILSYARTLQSDLIILK